MLTTVEFDDDRGLQTDEVTHERAKRMLSSKFDPAKLTTAQPRSETALSFSWPRAQVAGEVNHTKNSSDNSGVIVTI